MKVEIEVTAHDGKFWDLTMNYHNLPATYAAEIVNLANTFAAAIENHAGTATEDPQYTVSFKVTGPDVADPKHPDKPKGKLEAKADRLLYSQMVALQDAGIKMLANLNETAHAEIASGQRK